MAEYICKCEKAHEESRSGVTIRFGDDGAYHDIKCPCDRYMEVKNPKVGAPSIKGMDKFGRSGLR